MISRRAGALRREQQEKRRTNAPPSRKPDAPLGSLSSVALSCCISKATTLYNPFDGNVNSVTLLRHRLSTLRGAVQNIYGSECTAVCKRILLPDDLGKYLYRSTVYQPNTLNQTVIAYRNDNAKINCGFDKSE